MRRISLLSLGLLVGAATPAGADGPDDNELALSGGTRSLRSDSANAVTADNLSSGELSYARRLPLPLGPLQVWGVGSVGWGAATGQMFQTMATEVDTLAFTVGGSVRYALHPRFTVHARVDVGPARTALALRTDRTLDDASWHAVTRGSLGVDGFVVRSARISIGARLEVGYLASTGAALSPREAEPDDDTITLPIMDSSFGTLDLGGRFVNASLVMGF